MIDVVFSHISTVLSDKSINPFDIPAVENRAYRLGYDDVIRFLEKNRNWYIDHLLSITRDEPPNCASCNRCPF